MKLLIGFVKIIMSMIYAILKCMPTKDKVVFLSRQHDASNMDFDQMMEYMQATYPEYECKVLAKCIQPGMISKIGYVFHVLHQMYELATSRIAVLDTYCIPVSLLNHKKELVIIQIWHAIGAFKKFGLSVVGKEEGSSEKMAKYMQMHKNYDYVCTSSQFCIPFFAEAFGAKESHVKVFPLPRLDVLEDKVAQVKVKERIYQKYSRLKGDERKTILYVPTFRKDDETLEKPIRSLVEAIDFTRYDLIVKPHPLTKQDVNLKKVIVDHTFESCEMMAVADYIITDYSAIVFEAAVLNKPLFFYGFDYESYIDKRDFYIDYQAEIPGNLYTEAEDVIVAIEECDINLMEIAAFKEKYVGNKENSYTGDLCEFLVKKADIRRHGLSNS